MQPQVLAWLVLTTPCRLQWGVVKESLTVFVVSLLHRAELWAHGSVMPFKGQGVVYRGWVTDALFPPLLLLSQPRLLLWNSLAHIQTKPCRGPTVSQTQSKTASLCVYSHLLHAVKRGKASPLKLSKSSLHSSHFLLICCQLNESRVNKKECTFEIVLCSFQCDAVFGQIIS